jgi:hypothetical protein
MEDAEGVRNGGCWEESWKGVGGGIARYWSVGGTVNGMEDTIEVSN